MPIGVYLHKPQQGFQKGHSSYVKNVRKGWKHTPEALAKIGACSKGERNPAWKGGITKQPGYSAIKERQRLALKRGNGGSHTLVEWQTLKAKYNFTCPCCKRGEPEIKLEADHIIPIV